MIQKAHSKRTQPLPHGWVLRIFYLLQLLRKRDGGGAIAADGHGNLQIGHCAIARRRDGKGFQETVAVKVHGDVHIYVHRAVAGCGSKEIVDAEAFHVFALALPVTT